MRIELHCHSTWSDGSESPESVARRAEARGVELFCLTDHDSCRGYQATVGVLGAARTLRGVELSCIEEGATVHLLMYDVGGGDWTVVEDRLVEQLTARRARLRKIAARLEVLGSPIDVESIIAGAGNRTVGRPDIAKALVASGAVATTGDAFKRFLHDGGPADVPVARLTLADGLELGRSVGARMSLAHPHTLKSRAWQVLRAYKPQGLEGVEAFYGQYSETERRDWLILAADEGLVATGGSDFHGDVLWRVKNVGIEIPEPYADKLCGWLGWSRTT